MTSLEESVCHSEPVRAWESQYIALRRQYCFGPEDARRRMRLPRRFAPRNDESFSSIIFN